MASSAIQPAPVCRHGSARPVGALQGKVQPVEHATHSSQPRAMKSSADGSAGLLPQVAEPVAAVDGALLDRPGPAAGRQLGQARTVRSDLTAYAVSSPRPGRSGGRG